MNAAEADEVREQLRATAGHPLWPLCIPIELVLPRRRDRKEDDER